MKHRSLLICLSILVVVSAGCSSKPSAEEVARLEAEQALVAQQALEAAEQARVAGEQALAAQQALEVAEQARVAAEQALAAIKQQTKSAQQVKAAEAAKAKADAEHAKAIEEIKLAQERAKALEEARAVEATRAAEATRLAAKAAAQQVRSDVREKAAVQTVTLATGTPINVVSSATISTQSAVAGDEVSFILNEDITDGGRVIARRGTTVKGAVTESDPGGRVKGVATIAVTLNAITLPDGGTASLRTNDYSVEAESSVGKDATKTAIATGIGAAVGAIIGGGKGAAIGAGAGAAGGTGVALATHGNPAVIAPETVITFNLTAPLTFTLQQDDGRRR